MNESDFLDRTYGLIRARLDGLGRGCFIVREVGVGNSIADMVALVGVKGTGCRSALTVAESIVLAHLRNTGPTRIDILERRCGLPRSTLRGAALIRLKAWGLLDSQKGGRIIARQFIPSTASIVAIEAKLRRWRDALAQALEYRKYADESYVLLPERAGSLASAHVQEFHDAGIGLWVASDTELTEVLPAARQSSHCWRREFVFSRLVAASLQSSEQQCNPPSIPTRWP